MGRNPPVNKSRRQVVKHEEARRSRRDTFDEYGRRSHRRSNERPEPRRPIVEDHRRLGHDDNSRSQCRLDLAGLGPFPPRNPHLPRLRLSWPSPRRSGVRPITGREPSPVQDPPSEVLTAEDQAGMSVVDEWEETEFELQQPPHPIIIIRSVAEENAANEARESEAEAEAEADIRFRRELRARAAERRANSEPRQAPREPEPPLPNILEMEACYERSHYEEDERDKDRRRWAYERARARSPTVELRAHPGYRSPPSSYGEQDRARAAKLAAQPPMPKYRWMVPGTDHRRSYKRPIITKPPPSTIVEEEEPEELQHTPPRLRSLSPVRRVSRKSGASPVTEPAEEEPRGDVFTRLGPERGEWERTGAKPKEKKDKKRHPKSSRRAARVQVAMLVPVAGPAATSASTPTAATAPTPTAAPALATVSAPATTPAPVPAPTPIPGPSTAKANAGPEPWELVEPAQRYDPLQPLDGASSEAQATASSTLVNWPRTKRPMPCPVKECPAKILSSMHRHVVHKHLPKSFHDTSKDLKVVEEIFKERRRFWECLALLTQFRENYEALAENVLDELQRRDLGGRRPETVPPDLLGELALFSAARDDRRLPAVYITNLRTEYAIYSWRVAVAALNKVPLSQQQRLKRYLDKQASKDLPPSPGQKRDK